MKTMFNIHRASITALMSAAVLASALFAPSSQAVENDRIQMSAGHCYPWSSGGSVGRYNNGQITNLSSGSNLRVMCPVTRIAHADNFRITVYVEDNNPYWDYDNNRSGDVFCSVYDNNLYGESWHWHSWKGTGSHTGLTSITFVDSDMRHHTGGSLQLLCDIPKKTTDGDTRIAGYVISRQ